MMKQEFFQSGDPNGWSDSEIMAINTINCRCTMTPIIEDSIDAEFVVVDESKMIEEQK